MLGRLLEASDGATGRERDPVAVRGGRRSDAASMGTSVAPSLPLTCSTYRVQTLFYESIGGESLLKRKVSARPDPIFSHLARAGVLPRHGTQGRCQEEPEDSWSASRSLARRQGARLWKGNPLLGACRRERLFASFNLGSDIVRNSHNPSCIPTIMSPVLSDEKMQVERDDRSSSLD